MRCTARTQKRITLTSQEFQKLKDLGYIAKAASIHQTMGPNWRHIFFVSIDGSDAKKTRPHYYDVSMKPAELHRIAQEK